MTWGATPYLRTSENASACATMTAPKTMLLASLMAVAVSGFVPDSECSAADQRQQGLASFYGLLRTGGNDSAVPKRQGPGVPVVERRPAPVPPSHGLRQESGSRPRHRFPSRDEWSRRRENHACRRRRSKTSMTAESSTSIVKTTSFPLQTSAVRPAPGSGELRCRLTKRHRKPSTHDRRPECDAPFPSPCGPNR
jgi:hypothetical protein